MASGASRVGFRGERVERKGFDAFEELDARYLAGEAATYANTWSAIMSANAAFNRREMFATTADWVNIDHRRLTGFTPGDQVT